MLNNKFFSFPFHTDGNPRVYLERNSASISNSKTKLAPRPIVLLQEYD